MTTTTLPTLTTNDLVARALEAARVDELQRQQEKERAEKAAQQRRQETLEAEKNTFIRLLREGWTSLAGTPVDLTIDDADLIHDGKHWLWQFQPGVKIGVDYNAHDQQPFLIAFTAHNRSSYRLDRLVDLGHVLARIEENAASVEQQNVLKLQREQEIAEQYRRQQELDAKIAEIDTREPESPAPTLVLFENGLSGVQVVHLDFALRLRPFRLNGDDTGTLWEFDLNRGHVQALLDALESRSEALITPCGRLIATRPAGRDTDRPDEVLWMHLPLEYDTDYTTREIEGQVMVQRGLDTVAFKTALRDWLACAARRDAWVTERRTVLETR